jgi:hypothetical protein
MDDETDSRNERKCERFYGAVVELTTPTVVARGPNEEPLIFADER